MAALRISMWSANGVSRHKLELTHFLYDKHIDVMLLSETHLTNKYNFQIRGYLFYGTDHPDGKAHGGTGILIRNRIKHHFHKRYATNYLQATSINLQSGNSNLTIAAVYCPPNFAITEAQFMQFFSTLGNRFIAAGDYNAKHTYWGSRLVTPKGKQLYNAIIQLRNKLNYVSPGKPTYWPSDPNRKPDLIDFAVTKNIPRNLINAEVLSDLSSDHSPVLINFLQCPELEVYPNRLTTHRTNWLKYKKYVSSHLDLAPQFNTEADIDCSADLLKNILVSAAKISTPQSVTTQHNQQKTNLQIEQLVLEKRRLRRDWQSHRSPSTKRRLKDASRRLSKALKREEADAQRRYIQKLSPTSTKHPLWRAHPNLSAPIETVIPIRNSSGSWARSDKDRANTFAAHLRNVFQPNPATNSFVLPPSPTQTAADSVPSELRSSEIAKVIKEQMKPKKAPGYDLITQKMIIELPNCAICLICKLFNAIIRLGYFPNKWKKSIIIMIPKPGKDHTMPSSYRPISLLPCMSKLFEKCLLLRIIPYLRAHNVIPAHQFGFREKHGTIEQVNRITSEVRTAFEHREYCSAIFLDVSQAFDRVWLDGLMHKIKTTLPVYTHKLLESYLYYRVYAVRCNVTTSDDHIIEAGVPQGSVLGPTLYVIYTSDIPTNESLTTSTFADDTAILSRSRCPIQATSKLADHLVEVEKWLSDWRIKINEQKCKHVTFTLNRQTCPPLTLYNTQLPQADVVTYLGVHLDRRLTWNEHIKAKKTHLALKSINLHWLLNARSPLCLDYKVLLYSSTLKPIWTYGSQLWGNASNSSIDIIERAQSKILRTITGAPWYVRNENILRDLNIVTAKDEIAKQKANYNIKLSSHPNLLARRLTRVCNRTRLHRNDLPAQQ